jgi:hypothetical protein
MSATFFPPVAGATDCNAIVDACHYSNSDIIIITTQPQNNVAIVGDTKHFTIVATSAYALSYKWYRRYLPGGTPTLLTDSGRFSGTTTATLTTTGAVAGDVNYYYYCTVINAHGALTSNQVRTGILSFTPLVDTYSYAANSAAWNPSAACVFPITYAWTYGGTAVGTGSSYSRAVSIFDNNETIAVTITSLDRSVTTSATSFVAARIQVAFNKLSVSPAAVIHGTGGGTGTTDLVSASASGGYAPLTFIWSIPFFIGSWVNHDTMGSAIVNSPTNLQTDFTFTMNAGYGGIHNMTNIAKFIATDSRGGVQDGYIVISAKFAWDITGIIVDSDTDCLSNSPQAVTGPATLFAPTLTGAAAIASGTYLAVDTYGWGLAVFNLTNPHVGDDLGSSNTLQHDSVGLNCPFTAPGVYAGHMSYYAYQSKYFTGPTVRHAARVNSPCIPIVFTVTP